MWFVWKQEKRFFVAREQKLGARGHEALLEHSLDHVQSRRPFPHSTLMNKHKKWGWGSGGQFHASHCKKVFCSLKPWVGAFVHSAGKVYYHNCGNNNFAKKSICNLKSYLGRKRWAYSSNPSAQSSVMLTNIRTLTLVVVYRSWHLHHQNSIKDKDNRPLSRSGHFVSGDL